MDRFVTKPYEKQFTLALLLIAVLAYFFWTGSRYPSLDEKAMMSGAIQLEDPLSFEARFALTEGMSAIERVFWTTLNWINTNRKGMTFGVFFAAAFLTIAPYIRRKSFNAGFSNALLGMVIGTPLGVCVNCAAPIARGMYSAGMRAETTLSAMIASPTLNIVVLTMLFSVMPFYMAVAKIALSLIVILVAVPLICRLLPNVEIDTADIICPLPETPVTGVRSSETLSRAFISVSRNYFSNLWYIIKMTVPLMLLAGILGAIAATLVPQDSIISLPFSLSLLLAFVCIGLFLPVPIAFDVVVTGALLSAGLAPGYAMALLFSLGIFSIYSFFIVTQSVGQRAAWLMAASILVLSFIAGLTAQSYHQKQSDNALELLTTQAPAPWGAAFAETVATNVLVKPLASPSPAAKTGFTRIEGSTIGLDQPVEFSFRDMWPPFWEGRSLSSGDIDRDGDIDLVVASTRAGLHLYQNDGAGQFTRFDAPLGPIADLHVFNAVLADMNNDGWLDLFLTTYREGNYIWFNDTGTFDNASLQKVTQPEDAILTLSVSMADPDRDGDLDIALGQWAAGWYREIPGNESQNAILWNDAGRFDRLTPLPGLPGETLSILFSDIDNNGTADLLVGNDFAIPDYVYLGDGTGGLEMVSRDSGLIEHTTTTTMAIKTADLHNTGRKDLYFAQISGRSSGTSKTLKMQPLDRYCEAITNATARATCEKNMAIKHWYKSGNNFNPTYAAKCQQLTGNDQTECRAMLIKDLAIQRRDQKICDLIPANQPVPRAYCDIHFKPFLAPSLADLEQTAQQILGTNVLLRWDGKNWRDEAKEDGLEVGGWSWDTKIADFDHDGFQDVYIVNGTWVPNEVSPSNLFFQNDGKRGFIEQSGPFGLEDYQMTAAATTFDLDGDGDLDIVTYPINGPIAVFVNNEQSQGIVISLEDFQGNRDGIGAVVALEDNTGRTQSRELQLGGGFMSFDAPQIHFGLGDAVPTKLHVTWPDGTRTTPANQFEPGNHYTITRQINE